jgi:hypothetical protein
MEGDRHILTLGGILGDYPPTDPAGFDAFAASLPAPDIAETIQGAEPLDEGSRGVSFPRHMTWILSGRGNVAAGYFT